MSTPPIAKEPEVTGLSEVREKLERALGYIDACHVPSIEPEITSLHCGVSDELREALALLESEQGERIEVLPDGKFCECGSDLIHECGNPQCMNGQENREDWERED